MNWWVSNVLDQPHGPMQLTAWVFWVVFSICLHELAHGWAAIRQGDDTPIHTGHMTWNPMVHMGKMAFLMFALFGFTWGLMPVNPSRFRSRYGEAIVAFAGPACNALQFLILVPLLVLWMRLALGNVDPTFGLNMVIFLWTGAMINIVGFLFNLIPVPPLDGSRILGDFFPRVNELWRSEQGAVFSLIAFAMLFMFAGRKVWGFAANLTDSAVEAGAKLIGG